MEFFKLGNNNNYIRILLMCLIIVLAYWQIAFLQFSLTSDIIDVVFPFRYHFAESFQNGFFPFWNPYQQTGVPFYADLQAPTYYPELLFISAFWNYSIYSIQLLFVLYLIISGIGAYRLSFQFNKNRDASFFAGITYSLSGYMVAHGQHLFLIIGAAWIPFVILYYIRLNVDRNFINLIKCSLALFLVATGAYQALSIFLFYFLFTLFSFYIIKEVKTKNFNHVKSILKYNVYLLITLILLCLPLLISTLDVLNSVERLEIGVKIEQALENGFSFRTFLSFILPFSTVLNPEVFQIDPSIRNAYFGLIALIFFISALFRKMTTIEYIFLVFGLVVLASSMGGNLPIRELLFRYIPLMNLYHTTPFVIVFAVLFFILIAANYFASILNEFQKERKKVIVTSSIFLSLLLLIFIFSLIKLDWSNISFLSSGKSFAKTIQNVSLFERLSIQSLIQIVSVSSFLYIIVSYKKLKYPLRIILTIVILDMFLSTQLNMFYTAADINYKPYRMHKDLSLMPKGFPVPVDSKIIFNDQQHAAPKPFWRNTYVFSKQVSFQSFSSFKLKSYNKLKNDFPNLRDATLNNHLIYFSDTILPISSFSDLKIKPQTDSKLLFFDDEDYKMLNTYQVSSSREDQAQLTKFGVNRVEATTNTENDQFLTVLQSNFPGWKAFVDEKRVPIYTSNLNYKTIFLPKGKHLVSFRFNKSKILYAYFFSNGLFLLFCLILIYVYLKDKNVSATLRTTIIFVIIISIFIVFGVRQTFLKQKNNSGYRIENYVVSNQPKYHQEVGFEQLNDKIQKSNESFSGKYCLLLDSINNISPNLRITIDGSKTTNGTIMFSSEVFPWQYGEARIASRLIRNGQQIDWDCIKLEKQIERTNQWNHTVFMKNYYQLQTNDVIDVYIWNVQNKAMYVDDMKLDFYEF